MNQEIEVKLILSVDVRLDKKDIEQFVYDCFNNNYKRFEFVKVVVENIKEEAEIYENN